MTLASPYCCLYWIYAKTHVQQGIFSWDIEILNNIAKVLIKRFSYIGA